MSSPPAGGLPRVSCLVCTYNFAEFLPRALASALAQDYPADRLEIVVVDDGSTDATPDVVEPYLDRIVYIRKENGGLNSAINRALAQASGELIALLSGDDEWPATRVRRQVELLARRPEVGLVYGDLEVVDAEGAVVHASFWNAEGVVPHRGKVLGELVKRNFVSGGGLMVRAALSERFAPIPAEIPWEDWWIAARVAEVAELDYVEEPVYRYRLHGRNMNLGVPQERRGPLYRAELPVRRLLLRTALAGVEPGDALEGLRLFEEIVGLAARLLSVEPGSLLPVLDADRVEAGEAATAGLEAWRKGDVPGAIRSLVRAVASDPFDDGARALLAALMRSHSWRTREHRAERPGEPAVSIVIPVFDKLRLTRQCLEGIRRTAAHVPHEVIVVDDGSTDGTREFLRDEQARGLLRAVCNEVNEGFGRSCNTGASLARGEHVLFLNNDTIPLPGWLDALLSAFDDPGVGVAGSRLLYPGWQVQHAGILFDAESRPFHPHRGAVMDDPAVLDPGDMPAVTGACLLVRGELFRELQGFSEAYRMYVEDVDLCLAAWHAGFRVRYCPESVLIHLENASVGDVTWRDDRVREGVTILHERWAGRLPPEIAPRCGSVLGSAPAGVTKLRALRGLAFAEELIARPELLAAYGRTFTGADDATLVIHSTGSVDPLVALVERLGLDAHDGADLLAVGAEAGDERALADAVDYLLSGLGRGGPLGELPRYDETTVADLRGQVPRAA